VQSLIALLKRIKKVPGKKVIRQSITEKRTHHAARLMGIYSPVNIFASE
jgi:hypothetical protein